MKNTKTKEEEAMVEMIDHQLRSHMDEENNIAKAEAPETVVEEKSVSSPEKKKFPWRDLVFYFNGVIFIGIACYNFGYSNAEEEYAKELKELSDRIQQESTDLQHSMERRAALVESMESCVTSLNGCMKICTTKGQ